MSITTTGFTAASRARLRRAMAARSRILNEETAVTIKKAGVKLLVALRASTVISKNRRDIARTPSNYSAEQVHHSEVVAGHIKAWYQAHGRAKHPRPGQHPPGFIPLKARGKNPWSAIKSRFSGERVLVPIPHAITEKQARESRYRLIKRRGLARASFGWLLGKLGSGGSISGSAEIPGVATVSKTSMATPEGRVLSLKMINALNYITRAFRGSGKRDVASAMDRARAMLMSDTRRTLQRLSKPR